MPLRHKEKGIPSDYLAAEGIMEHDPDAITPCQRECASWLGIIMQMEHEAYLSQHPEIGALLTVFISNITRAYRIRNPLKEAAEFFTRSKEDLETDILKGLNLHKAGQNLSSQEDKPDPYCYKNPYLEFEIRRIIEKHYPRPLKKIESDVTETPNTESSSFLSIITSDTTLPTPEPVKTPDPTLSQTFFNLVSTTVDKAIFSRVDEYSLRYDTAYVELMKAVEEAMEIPVIDIKEDIATLFYNAYKMFELNIMEKEQIAAEIAWEKRMRKKLKRTLRRQKNFRGYETPPTPKSEISSHESYKVPPQRPCVCHPQFTYNRYGKDRFGIYLPRDVDFSIANVTVTPVISAENLTEEADVIKADTKSVCSKKSVVSTRTTASKRATFKE